MDVNEKGMRLISEDNGDVWVKLFRMDDMVLMGLCQDLMVA